jgi:endonuclease I/chitodextrinase
MKQFYILFILITTVASAQIPSNYYDSADGLTGYALKTELYDIISDGHVDQGYGALYSGYVDTHSDNITEAGYENDGTILLYYTENPDGVDPYVFNHFNSNCGNYSSEDDCYNREHLVPQSAFNSANPMRTDIHHVIPSDGYVNGQRGSYPFGVVATPNYTSLNGSKRGTSGTPGYSGTLFEPIDEFKGDIARAVLYFVTRYENTVDGYGGFDMFNGTENQALENWAIDLLLDWHYNVDPVDQRERDRNDASYDFQGNANPFVDHPEYANLIWNETTDTEAPTNPTNEAASNPTDNTINLSWTAATDNVGVASYDIYVDGVNTFNTNNTTFTAVGLNILTEYCFTIKAKDTSGNESGFSNEDCETTTNNGSGNNECALESFSSIPTDGSSSYTDRTWTGDNGQWNATRARTDRTIDGKAITIDCRNSSNGTLTSPMVTQGIGDLTVTTQREFAGTDGTLDVFVNGQNIGTIPYSDTAATTTLSSINIEDAITVTIQDNESGSARIAIDNLTWTCYTALSVDSFNLGNVIIHPNPSKGSILNINSTQLIEVTIFDILGKTLITNNIDTNNSQIDVSTLKKESTW